MKKNRRVLANNTRSIYKLLLLMKFTIALLLCSTFQVAAKTYSQDRITLKLQSAELRSALRQIEKKSIFRFLYNDDVIATNPKVNLDVENELVIDVLSKLLIETTLTFKVLENNLVVITQKGFLVQETKVTGKVKSASGDVVPGVTVRVKGSNAGTSTDASGNYSITVPDAAVLVFSSVGYASQEIPVNGRAEINVVLSISSQDINEVVVIGYGTASKRDLTGSITKVSGKEIADRPNANPVASLQAKVAGLSIVNSGTPGQEPDIRIRGTVSIGGVKPLYVVDGIFNDNISYINPNDIESIEVLKDPSSLAIFGVRGASGVIAVTTKKAKVGQIQVNFVSNYGVKSLVDKIKLVDANGFKTLYNEQQFNAGVPVNELFDYSKWTGNTDWINALTRTGTFNNNNISVTASTEKNRFYMSVGNTTEEGIIKRERLQKIQFSINDEFKVSKHLKIGFQLNGLRQNLPFSQADGLLFDARRILPITPVFNDQFGVYNQLAIQGGQITNPVMLLEKKWDKEIRIENRMVGSVFAEINFLKNFTFRSTLYGDMSSLDGTVYAPIIYTFNPTIGANGSVFPDVNNRLTSVTSKKENWNKYQQDYILTYKKDFNGHGLTAIGGFTTYYNEYRNLEGRVGQRANGDSIPDDKRFWYVNNLYGDPLTRRANSAQWERATVSLLFRALYNFKGKYLLNLSYRRDGSSQISPQNRFKNFYAVGAGWDVTKEKFMYNQRIFDFLKVKASWGVLGVQNTFGYDYPFYPELRAGNTAVFGDLVLPAYSGAYEPARNLTWETVEAKEFGVEFNVLKNRVHVEAVYYTKTTNDIMNLINLGNNRRRLDNVGQVVNKGVELSASWTQKVTKDLTLTVNGNFTTFNNKVISLGDKFIASEERPNQTEPGFPIGYFYGLEVEGVYQTKQEILKSPKYNIGGGSALPGDLRYKDRNGDNLIDDKDRTLIGNPTPDYTYGGSINLNYKGIDLSIDMGGVYGNEIYRYWGSSELPFTQFNYPAFRLGRWNGEGTSNWEPSIGSRPINRQPSTYGIEDGSYFRIRNLQLGYNFNQKTLAKAHIKNLRIFLNVQNLKTFKRNSGYTPEFGGDALSFGIDNGNGAIPRITTGGINVTF